MVKLFPSIILNCFQSKIWFPVELIFSSISPQICFYLTLFCFNWRIFFVTHLYISTGNRDVANCQNVCRVYFCRTLSKRASFSSVVVKHCKQKTPDIFVVWQVFCWSNQQTKHPKNIWICVHCNHGLTIGRCWCRICRVFFVEPLVDM